MRSHHAPLAALLALIFLVGCSATTHREDAKSSPPPATTAAKTKTPQTPQCALYGVVIAVGLLERDHGPWPGLVKLRPGWALVPPEAHLATGSFAGDPSGRLATTYATLLRRIDDATSALRRGDAVGFRRLIDGSRSTVAAVSSAAARAHVRCAIVSADRTSTLTFGG